MKLNCICKFVDRFTAQYKETLEDNIVFHKPVEISEQEYNQLSKLKSSKKVDLPKGECLEMFTFEGE